jgi:hypothetical protein
MRGESRRVFTLEPLAARGGFPDEAKLRRLGRAEVSAVFELQALGQELLHAYRLIWDGAVSHQKSETFAPVRVTSTDATWWTCP